MMRLETATWSWQTTRRMHVHVMDRLILACATCLETWTGRDDVFVYGFRLYCADALHIQAMLQDAAFDVLHDYIIDHPDEIQHIPLSTSDLNRDTALQLFLSTLNRRSV